MATFEPLLESRPRIERGKLVLPDKPGPGVEVIEADLQEWIVDPGR